MNLYRFLERNRFYALYIPLTIYWIIIFVLTTLPNPNVPKLLDNYDDKLKHFLAYTVLAVMVSLILHFQKRYKFLSEKVFLYSVLIVSVYGIFDEVHQIFIPGRSADIFDLLCDISGGILGTYLSLRFIKRRENRKIPKKI